MKEHIDEYIINSNNITISDERVQEKELLNKVLKAVSKLQKIIHTIYRVVKMK